MKTICLILSLAAFVLVGASEPEAKPAAAAGLKEIFPGVRVDLEKKLVEFGGSVPIDAHSKADLKVFLETTVCTADSKEHESLVVTRAKPSQVHAALLMIGLKPGRPGFWQNGRAGWKGVPPEGDPVTVRFAVKGKDGSVQEIDPADWIVNVKGNKTLREESPDSGWVFAGSKLVTQKPGPDGEKPARYAADSEGTLIGLTSFGTETIGWTAMYSPDSDKQEPEWIASKEKTPEIGTQVVVRIAPAKPGA